MACFSILIVTLTVLSLSANPTFSRVLDANSPHKADEDSIELKPLTNPFIFSSSTTISSSQFNFTIGNGIALVIISSDFPSRNMSFEALEANQFLGIRFYANFCKISSSSGVTDVSITSNLLKEGVVLLSWIDYSPDSKRLEIRLAKLDDPKPVAPLISLRVDLGEIEGEEVIIGLACSNERHEKSTSWSLRFYNFRSSFGYNGNLQRYEVPVPFPPFPTEHDSSVEGYKEKRGFISWFKIAIVCGFIGSCVYVLCVVRLCWWTEGSSS